jgi:imidazolonepropionase-like amidohydrolase
MHRRLVPGLLAFAFIALTLPSFADPPGVYALTGGTVHPVSGPDIPNGIVVIRDGLIEAVGAGIAIPADATTIDVKGMHVYPGLIDAQTSLGFPSPAPANRRRGGGGGGGRPQTQQTPLPETSAAYVAARNVNLNDDDADAKRATGVTTIVTAPSFGIFNGQSVVLNLGTGAPESRVVRDPAAIQISFTPRPAWTYPDSLMGVVAYIRQSFMDAQQYAAARAIYDQNPAGLQRPPDSPASAALGMALRKDVPVVFVADSDLMMRRVEKIAAEFGIRYVISGGRDAYRMDDELKRAGAPVFVSVHWPVAPAEKEDREEQPLRLIRERQLAPTSPALLAKDGVLFALVSGPAKTSEYVSGIRKAIDNGLSADDALRATTINPARILGIDRQLGSIEHGKIANLVVSDKGIFEKEAKVKRVFVDGREVRLPSDEEKARRGGAAGSGTGPLEGTWHLSVRAAEGDVAVSVTFHVEEGKLTGTYSSDRGSGDIRNGSFDGTTTDFTISARGKGEQEDWVFHGTLTDGKLSGTVATALGTLPFTGNKGQ